MTGAFCPIRRSEARHAEGAVLRAFRGWRDPDSNRGHHDFQSCGLAYEFRLIPRDFGGLGMFGVVRVLPHFAVVCRVKRPTEGSVGLFGPVSSAEIVGAWGVGSRGHSLRHRGLAYAG